MPERADDAPSPHGDDYRISRRSLFRGQMLRWASGVAEQLPVTPTAAAGLPPTAAAEARATAQIRAVWERDGHEPLLRALEPVAERVVGRAEIVPGAAVLDVGAGDGNVALAAWRRGAVVTACDLAPAMVERGRARCPQATWSVADVQDLPYADGAFDAVLSAFGAALAPDPLLAASELVRVTCPGGLVVLAAWLPQELPELLAPFAADVGHGADPAAWGLETIVHARLGGLEALSFETETIPLDGAEARYLLIRGRRPIPPM